MIEPVGRLCMSNVRAFLPLDIYISWFFVFLKKWSSHRDRYLRFGEIMLSIFGAPACTSYSRETFRLSLSNACANKHKPV